MSESRVMKRINGRGEVRSQKPEARSGGKARREHPPAGRKRERVPLSAAMALDLLTSVLGECDLAGVHVDVQVVGADVVLTVAGASLEVGPGGVMLIAPLPLPLPLPASADPQPG